MPKVGHTLPWGCNSPASYPDVASAGSGEGAQHGLGLLEGSDSKRQMWLGGGELVGRIWGAKRSHV